jgi:hypothetical protein
MARDVAHAYNPPLRRLKKEDELSLGVQDQLGNIARACFNKKN